MKANTITHNTIDWNKDIESYADSFYDYERNLKYFVDNCYKYNYFHDHNIDESIGNQGAQYIYDKYYIYSLILEDLINGGGIYG